MQKTSASCEFILSAEKEFDIEKITKILEIEPNKYYKNKKKYSPTKEGFEIVYVTAYIIKFDYEETYDVNTQLKKLYDMLKEKKDKIRKVLKLYNLYCSVIFGIEVYEGIYPAIYLEHEMIQFLNEINTDIEFDIIRIS